MTNNVKVFELDRGDLRTGPLASILRKTPGLTKAAETRIARNVRAALQDILVDVVEDSFRGADSYSKRTRNAYNIMRFGGVRTFGTSLFDLRGHIIGPSYIRANEEGATITPTNASALTIPLQAALKPDGTPKLPGPRSWKNIRKTFLWKSKKTGRMYIVYKNNDRSFVFLYVLVEEVELRRRGVINRAWQARSPEVADALGRALLLEFSNVDILNLARVTTKGKRGRRS